MQEVIPQPVIEKFSKFTSLNELIVSGMYELNGTEAYDSIIDLAISLIEVNNTLTGVDLSSNIFSATETTRVLKALLDSTSIDSLKELHLIGSANFAEEES